jgi:hypothetical protein
VNWTAAACAAEGGAAAARSMVLLLALHAPRTAPGRPLLRLRMARGGLVAMVSALGLRVYGPLPPPGAAGRRTPALWMRLVGTKTINGQCSMRVSKIAADRIPPLPRPARVQHLSTPYYRLRASLPDVHSAVRQVHEMAEADAGKHCPWEVGSRCLGWS